MRNYTIIGSLLEANSTLIRSQQPKRVRNYTIIFTTSLLLTGGHFNVKYDLNSQRGCVIIQISSIILRPFATGLELLKEHFISGALHNSAEQGDSPKCHENTRVVVIEEIMAWANDSDRQTRILWMNGAAGAGKTAIAHTIAEKCYEAGILAASFFCSRSVSGRNEETYLITTIVSQLIVAIPQMREHVGNALYKDHSLFSRSLETQLKALIVNPLELARSQQAGISDTDFLHSHPKFIILDGLDECGDFTSHQSVLRLILVAINKYNVPFFFLVASRPEQKIREAFNESTMGRLIVRLALDDKYLPDEDIRTFLMSKFQDIKKRHPSGASLPLWPSGNDIERLIRKSSGQFIYASTVIKFIDSHRHWPPDRLDIIFGILPPGKTTPFAEIDALYSYILSAASDNIEKILDIFTVLLFLRISHPSWQPAMPFLESFLSYRTGEIFMVLSDMHSIISVPSPHQSYMSLQFLHASLGDFLVDRSRSGEDFFLDPGVAHRKIATWMMNKIQTPSRKSDSITIFCTCFILTDVSQQTLGKNLQIIA